MKKTVFILSLVLATVYISGMAFAGDAYELDVNDDSLEAVSMASGPPAAAGGGSQMYTVGFYDDPGYERGDDYHGARVLAVNDQIDFISVRADDPTTFEAQTTTDPDVRYYNDDGRERLVAHYTPNDPDIGQQWGWDPTPGIDGFGAWDVSLGTTGTLVAVLDTGLDKDHADIGNYLQGFDFDDGDADPNDKCGHGTHVAGTVGALTDNGVGVAGTAQTTILPVKVLDKGGPGGGCGGSFAAVANGITYATDQGADIIQMSLGCDTCFDQAVADAVDYAWSNGVLIVASAGNAGPCSDCVGFPANDPDVMAISASTQSGTLASFSSNGPEVDLIAPGDGIYSTYKGGGYATLDGTSMAAPHVSGTAALALATGSYSNSQLWSHLESTASDLGLGANDQGSGAVNACAAVGSSTCGSGGGGGGGGDGGNMHVHDIQHSRQGSPHSGDLLIDIWIYDGNEAGVGSASVTVDVTDNGDGTTATGTASTASDGTITFAWGGVGGGSYTTCVTDLVKSGWTWDTAADHASGGNCHTESI